MLTIPITTKLFPSLYFTHVLSSPIHELSWKSLQKLCLELNNPTITKGTQKPIHVLFSVEREELALHQLLLPAQLTLLGSGRPWLGICCMITMIRGTNKIEAVMGILSAACNCISSYGWIRKICWTKLAWAMKNSWMLNKTTPTVPNICRKQSAYWNHGQDCSLFHSRPPENLWKLLKYAYCSTQRQTN